MNCYDLFNGDADGLCSLHQYRLKYPTESTIISGVKRDVQLMRHVTQCVDSYITVFDVSHLSNASHVEPVLSNGNRITWFDHHTPGEYRPSVMLRMNVDTCPTTCTSLLVDAHINGEHRDWALVGMYGDNLDSEIENHNTGFDDQQLEILKRLGMTLNYNGYGVDESDLTIHPVEVYQDMKHYTCPFEYHDNSPSFAKIHEQMQIDKQALEQSQIVHDSSTGKIILLPDSKSSARYSGVYSNQLVNDNPDQAFVVLTTLDQETYRVSIRAPKATPYGASKLAGQFDTGGGREKAAGINQLNNHQLSDLIEKFEHQFGW